MSQFEYVMVMVSLILARAIAQAMRGLSEVVTSEKRFWPHTAWLVLYVLLVVQIWWAYWDYNIIEEWRFTTYLFALFNPIIMFASVHLLVPVARTSRTDWQEHLSQVRRSVCGLGIGFIAMAVFANVIFFGSPLFHPYRIFQALFVALYLTGMFARSDKLHNAVPFLLVAALVTSQLVIRLNIGALMRG